MERTNGVNNFNSFPYFTNGTLYFETGAGVGIYTET
jgi:hypothetical protein